MRDPLVEEFIEGVADEEVEEEEEEAEVVIVIDEAH